MKNILLVLTLLVSGWAANAQLCCNVVDSKGMKVVTSNGVCVTAPNLATADCGGDGGDAMPAIVDSDGDGIADSEDDCPHEAGTAENDGCPELSEEEKKVLQDALEGVKFKTGSDDLTAESYAKLDKVVSLLKIHEDFKLKISGYTDNTGGADLNLKLSDDRAHACEKYIIGKGISASRITAKGYGEENPIGSNDTKEGRAKNRRVEFQLVH